jgi:hypothetical protein
VSFKLNLFRFDKIALAKVESAVQINPLSSSVIPSQANVASSKSISFKLDKLAPSKVCEAEDDVSSVAQTEVL